MKQKKQKNYVLTFNSITVSCRNLNKWRRFKSFTNKGVLDPLFTRLWALPTDLVFIQVNARSGLPIFNYILLSFRSSHRKCSVKNFTNFLRPATLLKKWLQHRCFPVKICQIFKNSYFEEYLRTTSSAVFIKVDWY